MIVALRILFATIFVVMVASTIVTSLEQSIFTGGPELLQNPWGVMTLLDAYFGFLTFYVWVAWREASWASRLAWFIAIMLLGNIAMSAYMLIALFRLPATASVDSLLLRHR